MANLPPVLKQYWTDANGDPLAGGKIHTYQAGTETPQATYLTAGGGLQTNPIVLDASGWAPMWLDPELSYKFIITDSNDVPIHTIDDVIGLLTANAVGTAALQDDAVTQAKIADDAVGADQLKDSVATDADRAVTTNHIRDAAITPAKMASGSIPAPLNYSIATSVAGNALTIALKTAAGADASATDPIKLPFRSATLTDGAPTVASVTAALSLVVPSSATLGHASATVEPIYVYGIYTGSAVVLAAVTQPQFNEQELVTTTAISASATSRTVAYSTAGQTAKPVILLAVLYGDQVTAGTWAANMDQIKIQPVMRPLKYIASSSSGSATTSNSSYTDVTNLSVSFTTSGRPVAIRFMSPGDGTQAEVGVSVSNAIRVTGQFRLLRDAVTVGEVMSDLRHTNDATADPIILGGPGILNMDDLSVPPGTYTYKLQYLVQVGGTTPIVYCRNVKMVVYEMGG